MFDFVRTGTAIAATVPMFAAGDKTAAARGLAYRRRTAVQSGVGASVRARLTMPKMVKSVKKISHGAVLAVARVS